MILLLDSHALLWAVTDPDTLSKRARVLLSDSSHTVFASAVSAWELSIKFALGKLPEAEALLSDYFGVLAHHRFLHLDITPLHALRAPQLAGVHKDPFDRMLAAQAILEGAALVSGDGEMRRFEGLTVEW